jgi:DNA-directed RNA polymerase specialized sigma24 family protein
MHAKLSREQEIAHEADEVAEARHDPHRPIGALDVVYEVLDRMPERQREALYLTEVCGLSEIQAALAMAMSRAAINARKRDALSKLRQCVDHALRSTASGEHTATAGRCSSSSDRPAMCA